MAQIEEIAKEKLEDLNAYDVNKHQKLFWFCKINGNGSSLMNLTKNKKKQIEGVDLDKSYPILKPLNS
jgi:hypothetical protein